MRKAADEREKVMDSKLAEMAATQRQLVDQISGLRADFGGVDKVNMNNVTMEDKSVSSGDVVQQSPKDVEVSGCDFGNLVGSGRDLIPVESLLNYYHAQNLKLTENIPKIIIKLNFFKLNIKFYKNLLLL